MSTMVELIRQWLLGITGAAMLVALADSLTPQGSVRKIGRLIGGLVLLIAVLNPLLRLDEGALTRALTEYELDVEAYSAQLEGQSKDMMKGIIEEQTSAYIQDKAAELGMDCQVTVETQSDGEWPVPIAVTVRGALSQSQQEELTQQIERDFAIPSQRQYYESGEAE